MDLATHVAPGKVRKIAEEILRDIPSESENVWWAAALHQHIHETVEYDQSVGRGYNRSPIETYQRGGNCVDISILLCSLFKTIDLTCRLVGIAGDDSDHMIVQVQFERSPRAVCDILTSYYHEMGIFQSFTFTWGDGGYFIADPQGSAYIGDIRALRDEGYVAPDGTFLIRDRFPV